MLVKCFKMRPTRAVVLRKFQMLESWYRQRQRPLDLLQTSIARLAGAPRDTFEKTLAEWIVLQPITADSVAKLEQLRYKMQVGDISKKIRHVAEFAICLDLFEVGLREATQIRFILPLRSIEDSLISTPDLL